MATTETEARKSTRPYAGHAPARYQNRTATGHTPMGREPMPQASHNTVQGLDNPATRPEADTAMLRYRARILITLGIAIYILFVTAAVSLGLALSDDPWVAVTLGAVAAAFGAFIALAAALPICCDR